MAIEHYQEGLLEMIYELMGFGWEIVEIEVEILDLPQEGLATILVRTAEPKDSDLHTFELSVEKKFLKEISTSEKGIVGYVYAMMNWRSLKLKNVRIKSPDCIPNHGWCSAFHPAVNTVRCTDIRGDFFPEFKKSSTEEGG